MHVMRKYNAKPQRICIFFYLQLWPWRQFVYAESSGGRGKRKGLRGKRIGATKTNAFVAIVLTLYMKSST